MPHSLPVLAAVAAAPLLGLAVHAAAMPGHGAPLGHAVATLPNNLCSSCHGGRGGAARMAVLGARDVAAARTYLRLSSQG